MAIESEADVVAEIRRIISGELEKSSTIKPNDNLVTDLGLDSLDLTILAVGLEDRFRIRLSEEDSIQVSTVAELATLVARRAAQAAP
ncbi:MAG: acyl carrier protein [Myxococcaceae bacterium]